MTARPRVVILAEARGAPPPRPFRYRDKGTMAVIGRNAAVASIWRLRLTGRTGWAAWLTVHMYYLIGFRNRAVVLINWAGTTCARTVRSG